MQVKFGSKIVEKFIEAIFLKKYEYASKLIFENNNELNSFEIYEIAQKCSGLIAGFPINYHVAIALYELAHKGNWDSTFLGVRDYPSSESLIQIPIKSLTSESIGNWLKSAEAYEEYVTYYSYETYDWIIIEEDPTNTDLLAALGAIRGDAYCLHKFVEKIEKLMEFLQGGPATSRGRWMLDYIYELHDLRYLHAKETWIEQLA
jgi:hypothetical protein